MSIYLGATEIVGGKIHLGGPEVSAVYVGADKIWPGSQPSSGPIYDAIAAQDPYVFFKFNELVAGAPGPINEGSMNTTWDDPGTVAGMDYQTPGLVEGSDGTCKAFDSTNLTNLPSFAGQNHPGTIETAAFVIIFDFDANISGNDSALNITGGFPGNMTYFLGWQAFNSAITYNIRVYAGGTTFYTYTLNTFLAGYPNPSVGKNMLMLQLEDLGGSDTRITGWLNGVLIGSTDQASAGLPSMNSIATMAMFNEQDTSEEWDHYPCDGIALIPAASFDPAALNAAWLLEPVNTPVVELPNPQVLGDWETQSTSLDDSVNAGWIHMERAGPGNPGAFDAIELYDYRPGPGNDGPYTLQLDTNFVTAGSTLTVQVGSSVGGDEYMPATDISAPQTYNLPFTAATAQMSVSFSLASNSSGDFCELGNMTLFKNS